VKDPDEPIEPPHPRETTAWFGHAQAERALLDAFRSGLFPHAWLIGGPPGVGKATLAYRMARFVLANPDPAAPAVQVARSLALAADHPVVRRVAAQSHADLLVLERTAGPSGALRTVITVDEVRRTVSFFGSTAGEGGWRVCVVDTADELQYPQASNALLKVLEEPPRRALFLIATHAPGRLLATIRSRCRRLTLRPLGEADVARAVAAALDRAEDDAGIREAARAAEGSAARAITLIGGRTLALRRRAIELLERLPALDPQDLHALGDMLGRADGPSFESFVDTLRDWLSARLARDADDPARLARVAEVWEKLNRAAQEAEEFNLERKPMVFAVFGLLAQAARG
jgi:DNA polymerase III subunit delta'